MRKYELVWILGVMLMKSKGAESIKKSPRLLLMRRRSDGTIFGGNVPAYPIKKNSEGYYLQANFEIDGPQAQDFERAIYADQSIIRHLLVREKTLLRC
ncbi:MAG: hypothetical protein CM1200mP39_15950 [Dehalococcoidia bacterium]|nr:MAG: hypothetical protein CM1200mP39_15950 [Dehalococcoidia bacterium]